MDLAERNSDVSVTMSGVAPVTLIAQISVTLIAVAVTAVYILKHLPDPGEDQGANTQAGTASLANAQRRDAQYADALSHEEGTSVDGVPGTSRGSTDVSTWAQEQSNSRGEYRSIISNDEYRDLCSSPADEKPRSAKKKSALSGQSKEWPTSLESIDEEDEDWAGDEVGRRRDDEPSPKQSPKRGTRVPSWYFSRSSSGIPTLPKDRDIDTQFSELASQASVCDSHPIAETVSPYSETVSPYSETLPYIDDTRKKAITGFPGTPIGVLQRKPWPTSNHNTYDSPGHEYSDVGQTSNQSERMESDHAKAARMKFMLKGRVSSFESTFTGDGERIPEIQIHDPNTNDLWQYEDFNVDLVDAAGSSEWVETLASTVVLPGKYANEIETEVIVVEDDEDVVEERESQKDDPLNETGPRPIPQPRTSLTNVAHVPQSIPTLQVAQERAPPFNGNGPTNGYYDAKDAGPRHTKELVSCTKRPGTEAHEGQQPKQGVSRETKTDTFPYTQKQTKSGFIENENIDSADKNHNGPLLVTHNDDTIQITPDSRIFTIVGKTRSPIIDISPRTEDEPEHEEVNINLTPGRDIVVVPTDTRNTPARDPEMKEQPLTTGLVYETEIPSLSTKPTSDDAGLKWLNGTQSVTELCENVETDFIPKEQDATFEVFAALETDPDVPQNCGVESNLFKDLENGINGHFLQDSETEDQSVNLDKIRSALSENLPLKRPNELMLNKPSERKDSKPGDWAKASEKGEDSLQGQSDSEILSPSEVVSQQRARVQRSLGKLNVPDWYKKSKHYNRLVNNTENDLQDSQSESEPRMTRSPSSCLSDCWSVTSPEEASSLPAVSTKLAFQSEARYRRDFPTRFLHEPIRNAFSCAELQTQSSRGLTEDDAPNYTKVIDDPEITHGADDSIHSGPLNQISSSLNDINSESSPDQPSPSRGLRMRSKSVGDHLDQITYFDSLAVKRLERHLHDSIFFVTGYINDSADDLNGSISDGNSQFASGSLPDESIDDMEHRLHMYEIRESLHKTFNPAEFRQEPTNSYDDHDDTNANSQTDTNNLFGSVQQESMNPFPVTSTMYDNRLSWSDEKQTEYAPMSAPLTNIMEETRALQGFSVLNSISQDQELKPDPRYNPDGSKNFKLSPRFAMITPEERESLKSSPRSVTPRKMAVRILVTDTSLEDDESGVSMGHASDQDPVSASSSDQETVVDGTTNTWTPLDLEKLKDSDFAAVLSVITSRHMQPGNRSGLCLPGSEFVPPKEVSMEEIVDSLLGLPYERAASAVDLNSSGYRGSSSTSSPLTCSTPDLSSSWNGSRESTPVSSSDKSHSVDSLYSEDGNVLNSIIVGRRIQRDGSSQGSYGEGESDTVGDEIIMVKCSYKKCARTKELAEARKSFKTCHNCYTYYCSRQCRKLHWPRHKKRCLFGRVNSACKHVIYHSRYNGQLQEDLTRVARTGYLSRGRGAILLIFPDTQSAENYTEKGFDALPSAPTYSTVRELDKSELFGDHTKYLLEMCRSYDPERKFVLNVAIMSNAEQQPRGNRPRRTDAAVKKCAKLSLMPPHVQISKDAEPIPETLIITSPSGSQGDGALDRKSRQVCFVHIQRQLRQRGVNLRHQHAEIYDRLCRWVEDHEHFTPTTIYPLDERTEKRFMCILMPESEPNDLGWINNPDLLEDIDLDAELEKLENVAGMMVTDL